MTIIKEIIELLHDNDCVILPNFGAFILKNKSAYIKDDEFFPPSKFVSFNLFFMNRRMSTNFKKASQSIFFENFYRV